MFTRRSTAAAAIAAFGLAAGAWSAAVRADAVGTIAARFGQRPTRAITLVQGTQVGRARFPPGDTPKGGNGQPVDGIEGSSREMLAVHIHAHLSLFLDGQQIAIPYGVGIVRPFQVQNGFVGIASGLYWLHTHDATGIIHVESPDNRTYTLGNFFDIWGEPLTTRNVAGLDGEVHTFVDGRPHPGNPRDIVLTAHEQITLEVGDPVVAPPVYVFPDGL
jgi:hypothetical protein